MTAPAKCGAPSLAQRLIRKRGAAARWLSALALGAQLSARVSDAYAVDPFEIQVYDGTANAPGVPGLELHLNTVPSGRKVAEPPELAPHHQSHFTLEPSLGLAPWWELGGYFQSALGGDGRFRYGGVKLRSKFVTQKGWSKHFRLGVNLELSRIPQAFDRVRWGGEMRPIAAFEDDHFILAANPILELSFAGPDAHSGPSFAPALMAKVKIADRAAVGVEYYADLGPLSGFDPVREQQHYLFEACDLLGVPNWELNAGVGEGLTERSNALVVKAILGYSWEAARLWSH